MVYGGELEPNWEYRRQIENLALRASEQGLDDPVVRDLFREEGITYVYVGQQQGRVWNPEGDHINPEQPAASADYELVYHQDRVWAFAVRWCADSRCACTVAMPIIPITGKAGTRVEVIEPTTAMAWDRREVEEFSGDWSHQASFA